MQLKTAEKRLVQHFDGNTTAVFPGVYRCENSVKISGSWWLFPRVGHQAPEASARTLALALVHQASSPTKTVAFTHITLKHNSLAI